MYAAVQSAQIPGQNLKLQVRELNKRCNAYMQEEFVACRVYVPLCRYCSLLITGTVLIQVYTGKPKA